MTIWDDRILELIRQEGGATVKVLSEHPKIRVSRSTVSRRCSVLAEKGLLNRIGEGAYVISDDGEAYLDGELDASTLDESDDEADETTNGNQNSPPNSEKANGA